MIRTADPTAEDVAAAVALSEQHPDAAADLLRTAQRTAAAILPPHDADDAASAAAILAAPAALAACQRTTMDGRKPAEDYRPHVRSIVRTLAKARTADDDALALDALTADEADALADPYGANRQTIPTPSSPDPAARYALTDADRLAALADAEPAAMSAAAIVAHDHADTARKARRTAQDAAADAADALTTGDPIADAIAAVKAATHHRRSLARLTRADSDSGRALAEAVAPLRAAWPTVAAWLNHDAAPVAPRQEPQHQAPRTTEPGAGGPVRSAGRSIPTSGPASLAVAWRPTDVPGIVLARIGGPDGWTAPRALTDAELAAYLTAPTLADAYRPTADDRAADRATAATEPLPPVARTSGRNRPRVGNTGPTVPARLSR